MNAMWSSAPLAFGVAMLSIVEVVVLAFILWLTASNFDETEWVTISAYTAFRFVRGVTEYVFIRSLVRELS